MKIGDLDLGAGIKITEDQVVSTLVQTVERVATKLFADPDYLTMYEKFKGCPLNSPDIPSDVQHFKVPIFGGGCIAIAYLCLACKEVTDARLDRLWKAIMYSNNELYGLKKYCEEARNYLSREMKNKDLISFFAGKKTGDKINDKISGIMGLGAAWIADQLAPDAKLNRNNNIWIIYPMLHRKPIEYFYLLISGFLDSLYGEPIPLPPEKKGFFKSIFG